MGGLPTRNAGRSCLEPGKIRHNKIVPIWDILVGVVGQDGYQRRFSIHSYRSPFVPTANIDVGGGSVVGLGPQCPHVKFNGSDKIEIADSLTSCRASPDFRRTQTDPCRLNESTLFTSADRRVVSSADLFPKSQFVPMRDWQC